MTSNPRAGAALAPELGPTAPCGVGCNKNDHAEALGSLHLDDPGLQPLFAWAMLVLFVIPPEWDRSRWSVVGLACVASCAALQRLTHRAKLRVSDGVVHVSGLWRRLELTRATTLHVREAGNVVSIWLTDGRFATLGRLPPDTQRVVTTLLGSTRSDRLVFRLRGSPVCGRWTRMLAGIPGLTSWIRPRLYIDEARLVLDGGWWVRRVPLSNVVRLSITGRGVELALSDSTRFELVTFGGVSCKWHRHLYEFNELLCAHLYECRARALARALRSYRSRSS